MKVKRFAQLLLSCLLAAAIVVPAAACKNKIYDNENYPFIAAIQELDGVFSPFFATSAYDTEVAGLTQISMLGTDEKGNITVGESVPTVVKDYTENAIDSRTQEEKNKELRDINKFYTKYEFLIKNGIKFSDAQPLTINDVLFNMYVYLDPVYTGSSTMYSTDIAGLIAYKTQTVGDDDPNSGALLDQYFSSIAAARRQAVLDYYPLAGGTNPSTSIPEATILADIEKVKGYFKEELASDYNNYSASLDTLRDEFKDINGDQTISTPWQLFCVMNNLVTIEYDKNDTSAIISIDFKEWEDRLDGLSDEQIKEYCVNAMYNNYVGTVDLMRLGKLEEILMGWGTGQTYLQYVINSEKTAEFEKNGKQVKTVSGITTRRTNTFNNTTLDGDYDVLSIVIHGVDPKAIYNFGITVTPMHYYSNPEGKTSATTFTAADGYKGFDADEGHFGFRFSNQDYMNDVINGVKGIPMGAGVYQASNENRDTDISKIVPTGTGKDAFFGNGTVYYVRNNYFETTGKDKNIYNAKIKYFKYFVSNSSRLFDNVKTGTVHYADPSAKNSVMQELNDPKRADKSLTYQTAKNNGYGYVGVNPRYVEDQNVRQAIMFAMDTRLVLDYYPNDLANNIYRPMSDQNWAYPEDINTPYYSAWDANSRYSEAIAKEKIKTLVAGYSPNSNGVLEKKESINGQVRTRTLKFTFTISGADLQDHPSYTMFSKAQRLLNECGFEIKVSPDSRALSKLAAGELQVWAAAWSAAIDPDMYQVYHKDSKATSVLNWGYPQLLGLKGETGYGTTTEKNLIEELSGYIDQGRSTLNKTARKATYRTALNTLMELAVELPTYQRSNIYVYKKNVIDEKSIYTKSQVTTYRGPLSDMWKVSFV